MSRTRTMDCTSAAAIALVALALGGCPPKPGPEPVEPPGNEPMTGSGSDGALVPGQTQSPDPSPSPDPNEPSEPTPGPPQPAPPPGALDPSKPQ